MNNITKMLCGILFVLASYAAFAQTAGLMPNANQVFLDNNGNPLASGTVTTYVVGTTTLKTTWQDAAETIPNTNPIVLNAGGRAIIYGDGNYRQVVRDRLGNLIWDAVTSAFGTGSASLLGDGTAVGTVLPWSGITAPVRYVFAYGQEISRTTYASLYAAITLNTNANCASGSPILTGISDTTQIPIGAPLEATCLAAGTTVLSKTSSSVTASNSASITVSVTARFFPWGNGNGTSTFNVPDLRGRVLPGRDNMGGTAAARLTTAIYGAANPDALGAAGGAQSATLGTTNLPAYTPAGTIVSPSHSHFIANVDAPSPGVNVDATNVAALARVLGNDSSYTLAGTATAATTGISSSTTTTSTFTGTAQGGAATAFSIIQPSITMNYIVKVTPDTSISTLNVVTSLGSMVGDITCGTGLTCSGGTISASGIGTGNMSGPSTSTVGAPVIWNNISGTSAASEITTITAQAVCDGSTNDAPVIQAAIDFVASLSGTTGIVLVPLGSCAISTGLTIRTGIKLVGVAHGYSHDVGSATYGTRLVWTGGSSGTAKMIDMSPTEGASAQNIQGGGVVGIGLLCQNLAGYGLYSKSVFNGDFDIYTEGCITSGAYLSAAASLGEAQSWQNNNFSMLSRQFDASNGPCLILDGTNAGSGGNVSFNNFQFVKCLHLSQVGIDVKNADNNILWNVVTFAAGTPTAGVILRSGATVSETARNNLFMQLSPNFGITSEGTNVGTVAAGPNKIIAYDKGNGSPTPSCGTGSTLEWQSNNAALNGVVVGTNCGGTISSGTLTANLPVIGGGAGAVPTVGTRSGNTTAFVTTTGSQTSGNCVSIDASGNHIANGAACQTGTVTSLTPGAGTTSTLTATAPGSAITTTGTLSSAHLVNAQTGTTYAILDADRAKLITTVNSSAQAYSIAQAGAASAFQSGWYVDIANNSTTLAGIVTVTPTTSTINGAASYAILPGQTIRIVSDGTNYQIENNGSANVVYTYTPTLTCGSGTLTTAAATGRYQRMGKAVLVTVSITVTTVGSCASNIGFNLPIATNSTLGTNLFGRNGTSGVMVGCTAASASTAITCNNFDATTIGVTTGQTMAVQGVYEGA